MAYGLDEIKDSQQIFYILIKEHQLEEKDNRELYKSYNIPKRETKFVSHIRNSLVA